MKTDDELRNEYTDKIIEEARRLQDPEFDKLTFHTIKLLLVELSIDMYLNKRLDEGLG